MTNTELHELAKDPQAFDTELARLHDAMTKAQARRDDAWNFIHLGAGDRRVYTGRSAVWQLRHTEAVNQARQMADEGVTGRHNIDMGAKLVELATAEAELDDLLTQVNAMDEVYYESPWSRFFPSVTKSQPHIHRSLTCHTLHATTVMQWAPGLSGKTDEQAVAELDEALCTVCFPTAPVALHNYQSKRSQAERDQRAAEKLARDAKLAAKQLTEAEQFRTQENNDRITTVAACKELIRKAVEQEVTLAWYSSPAAAQSWQADADSLARVRSNVAASLVKMQADASQARTVLIARETVHPGWGMNATEIEKMKFNKSKSARKEWGL
jgi:hypothetical protein